MEWHHAMALAMATFAIGSLIGHATGWGRRIDWEKRHGMTLPVNPGK